jgi:hypothetical protein
VIFTVLTIDTIFSMRDTCAGKLAEHKREIGFGQDNAHIMDIAQPKAIIWKAIFECHGLLVDWLGQNYRHLTLRSQCALPIFRERALGPIGSYPPSLNNALSGQSCSDLVALVGTIAG